VQKVSIVPRGKALGYTLNLPQEDRYLKTREELIDYMKMLLSGRVAEQITFGRVTTGASDDLERVTSIARSMVHEYGMGSSIRALQLPSDDYGISESLRRTRDEEVQEIADEAYRASHRLISDHRDLLDEIAETLLRNEVIEHDEIQRIMAKARRTEPAEEERVASGRAEVIASEPPRDERGS
jgi:cell division protease FtsH